MPIRYFITRRTTRDRTGLCPVCGRQTRRSKTFTANVSPYHPAVASLGIEVAA